MTEAAEILLFTYGTLQLESVQRANFGRTLVGTPDTLTAYAVTTITVANPAVISASGTETHLALVPDETAPPLPGIVLRITASELTAADIYEGEEYRRIEAPLASGTRAWVYIKA